MKKRIFIMAHSLELGGAEISLLGFLENLDYEIYKVDVFLLRHKGELMRYLPKDVNLLSLSNAYSAMGIPIIEALKKRQIRVAFGRLRGKQIAKKRVKKLQLSQDNNVANEYSHKYTVSSMPMMSEENYDLAISFMSPHYYVAQKVNAKKKVAWIHTDYSTFEVDEQSENQMWKRYDKIISISDSITEQFVKKFPSLEDKIYKIENIVPIKYMNSLVNDFSAENEMPKFDGVNLLSIGRFVFQKNFENIPDICKRIVSQGVNVRWYIIGFGGDEQLIRDKIKSNHMEENVIILGKKENPYPYIKACDIYVQPSRYEGKSVAVREAQILGKPIIITNYPSASSQIKNGYDGIVVPLENSACAERIKEVIENKELRERLYRNIMGEDYVGKKEINKFYRLLEEE